MANSSRTEIVVRLEELFVKRRSASVPLVAVQMHLRVTCSLDNLPDWLSDAGFVNTGSSLQIAQSYYEKLCGCSPKMASSTEVSVLYSNPTQYIPNCAVYSEEAVAAIAGELDAYFRVTPVLARPAAAADWCALEGHFKRRCRNAIAAQTFNASIAVFVGIVKERLCRKYMIVFTKMQRRNRRLLVKCEEWHIHQQTLEATSPIFSPLSITNRIETLLAGSMCLSSDVLFRRLVESALELSTEMECYLGYGQHGLFRYLVSRLPDGLFAIWRRKAYTIAPSDFYVSKYSELHSNISIKTKLSDLEKVCPAFECERFAPESMIHVSQDQYLSHSRVQRVELCGAQRSNGLLHDDTNVSSHQPGASHVLPSSPRGVQELSILQKETELMTLLEDTGPSSQPDGERYTAEDLHELRDKCEQIAQAKDLDALMAIFNAV